MSTKKDWYNRQYLRSLAWRQTRLNYLGRVGWKCERCHVRACRLVHHLSYARLYHEQPEDLIALCNECHEKLHGLTAANDNQVEMDFGKTG